MKRFVLASSLLLLAVCARLPVEAQPATPPASPDPVQGATQDAADVLEDDGSGDGDGESSWSETADRWLFNAEERTRAGRAALGSDNADRAVERFDTALRLAPDDAVARFNAGTARLMDERPGAGELLEAAAREAPESLKAAASYNLGNARLKSNDLQGAIEAYKDALRADSSFGEAKHNLEVAQRMLEQQQQNQQNQDQQNQDQQDQQDQEQQQDQQQNQDQDQPNQEDQEQQQDQNQGEQDQEQQDQNEEQQNQEQEQEQDQESDETEESGGAGQGGEESPLPQFQDLPDMSAEEAAAILEAIQNMERQDRREQALEAAKKAQASGKKDW